MTQVETAIRAIKTAEAVYLHMIERGDRFATYPGEKNLVYIEGMSPDFTPNPDTADRWNDLRCLLEFLASGQPYFSYMAQATCEPGLSATSSFNARRNGGVARLQLIQYKEACIMGFHKSLVAHPALVQAGEILVHRDANKDGKRTGDPIHQAWGINHHGTKIGFKSERVGMWSEGCCVGRDFLQHLRFIEFMKQDPRYIANPGFKWDFALVDAGELKIEMV